MNVAEIKKPPYGGFFISMILIVRPFDRKNYSIF